MQKEKFKFLFHLFSDVNILLAFLALEPYSIYGFLFSSFLINSLNLSSLERLLSFSLMVAVLAGVFYVCSQRIFVFSLFNAVTAFRTNIFFSPYLCSSCLFVFRLSHQTFAAFRANSSENPSLSFSTSKNSVCKINAFIH